MKNIKIGVIGLGYVGLPVAIAFSKKYKVFGFDINSKRINELNRSIDNTLEISTESLNIAKKRNLILADNINDLKNCNIYIITVPTPINTDNSPDLTALVLASESVGKILSKNDIVIYESTVYPGCTEEVCVPKLEEHSKMLYNQDFFCGYSPERINPGDKKRTIEKIVKVVSGSNENTTKKINQLYSSVIEAGTYVASSIKVAEAAKVIENAQRDINIAFINELSKIFSKLNIDTNDVIDAASTKWNFLDFRPGLVGGHCIGVDPYYLAYKAKIEGYTPEIILAGRKVNNSMGKFIVSELIQAYNFNNGLSDKTNVLILGATFKENCPDYRNTRVLDIFNELEDLKVQFDVVDPWIDSGSFFSDHNIEVINELPNKKYNIIIVAVAHDKFKTIDYKKLKINDDSIIYDVKGILEKPIYTSRL
jgi:UDP-N-acetyl-D-glucosamine/UDP-N-acetyl-D-galactosamine dehydrogenase